MRSIYVNLPVKDLDASKQFYEALGFANNPDYTDETAAAMEVSESIAVMLLTEEKFKSFINGEIADPATTEVLNCLTASSKKEVDGLFDKAVAAGGTPWREIDEGPMYFRSFQDLDGHVWEILSMEH